MPRSDFEGVPFHLQYSLNINGLKSEETRPNKLKYLKNLVSQFKDIGIVHLQETHLNDVKVIKYLICCLKGEIKGFSPANGNKGGTLSWIPPNSPLLDKVHDYKIDDKDLSMLK